MANAIQLAVCSLTIDGNPWREAAMKSALIPSLFIAAMVHIDAPSYAGLIVNGSFENPALTGSGTGTGAVGNFTRFTSSSFVPGWTLTAGNVEVFHEFGSGSDQSVDLTGFPASAAATIEQTISTTIGLEFQVDFDLNGGGSTNTLKEVRLSVLRADDSVVASQVFQFNSQGVLTESGFVNHSLTFIADEASSTIQFESLHTASSNGPIIDNVEVTAVPEPSSLALLATGLVGVCGIGWRRRRHLTAG